MNYSVKSIEIIGKNWRIKMLEFRVLLYAIQQNKLHNIELNLKWNNFLKNLYKKVFLSRKESKTVFYLKEKIIWIDKNYHREIP